MLITRFMFEQDLLWVAGDCERMDLTSDLPHWSNNEFDVWYESGLKW